LYQNYQVQGQSSKILKFSHLHLMIPTTLKVLSVLGPQLMADKTSAMIE
jgi:hypothetical protein